MTSSQIVATEILACLERVAKFYDQLDMFLPNSQERFEIIDTMKEIDDIYIYMMRKRFTLERIRRGLK